MNGTHEMLQRHWGGRVKIARQAAGLSQIELAERVGVDQTTISRIERGVHSFPAETLIAVAVALESELEEIFIFPPGLVSRARFEREAKSKTEAVA